VLPENPPLAAALAAGDADAARAAILAGTLIVALMPEEETPRVAATQAPDGTLCALAFSSPATLALWSGTDRTVYGPGRAMAALIRDQGLPAATVDVAGPVAALLDHGDLRALASGVAIADETTAPTAARPAPLRLRAPDPPLPAAAAAALAGALRGHDGVAAAYVFEGPRGNERRHLVVGLDMAGDPAAAIDAADAALAPHVAGAAVNYTLIEHDAIFASLRETVGPAYERS
jgi:type III secretion system (T3SS) SseB-like protein